MGREATTVQGKERKQLENLIRIYTVLTFVVIGILIAKLAWMQLVETDFYASRADAQRNRLMTIAATRCPPINTLNK